MTVLELLAERGPLRPAEIAVQLQKQSASIRAYLARLVREGQVSRLPDGRYTISAAVPDSGGEEEGSVNTVYQQAGHASAAGTSPFVAFATGFEDASGQEPEERLVLAEVRRFLAERGISPFLEMVDEELASELYLAGRLAGEDAGASARHGEAEQLREQVAELREALKAAAEENRELVRKLEEMKAENRQLRQEAIELYLRYTDLLDGNLNSQHLADLLRKKLQNEMAATARRLGIG